MDIHGKVAALNADDLLRACGEGYKVFLFAWSHMGWSASRALDSWWSYSVEL